MYVIYKIYLHCKGFPEITCTMYNLSILFLPTEKYDPTCTCMQLQKNFCTCAMK